MGDERTNVKASDDLDLGQLFRSIGKGFRNLGTSTIAAVAEIRKTFIEFRTFFAVVIGSGVLLAIIYSFLVKKDYYKSSMVLNCNYLNSQVLSNIVEKLNLLSNVQNIDVLAQELNVSEDVAKNILKFEFQPFISEDDVVEMEVLRAQLSALTGEKKELVNQVIEKLSVENKDSYQITVLVLEPGIVKQLEKSLIDYFERNEYIKRRREINTINLNQKKKKLLNDAAQLDSLKQVLIMNYNNMGKNSKGSNNVILGDDRLADPISVFKQDLEINEEILEIDKQLYLRSDFEIVDPFATFKHSESIGVPTVLLMAIILSIIVGYIAIGIWRFDRYLADFKKGS